jgi:putative transposase
MQTDWFGHGYCLATAMAHPYPAHRSDFSYTGPHRYFLTFCTDSSRAVFTVSEAVHLVWMQFLRAASEQRFEITAFCFMPDHVHILVRGLTATSNCRTFIRAAKQYSGYFFTHEMGYRLWQRYGYERVIRDDMEMAFTIGYIVANPVRAGLVGHPLDYPFTGSQRYSLAELLQICEYSGKWL